MEADEKGTPLKSVKSMMTNQSLVLSLAKGKEVPGGGTHHSKCPTLG